MAEHLSFQAKVASHRVMCTRKLLGKMQEEMKKSLLQLNQMTHNADQIW